MLRAICSRVDISADSEAREYLGFISDLLDSSEVARLSEFTHHLGTTRFQHSLNVSYYNYLLCRRLGLDSRAGARAGLLHDLFFYDRKTYERAKGERLHHSRHPIMALKNAQESFELSYKEQDIILRHMWPMTITPPKYRETFVIVLVDKYCCMLELCEHFFARAKRVFNS